MNLRVKGCWGAWPERARGAGSGLLPVPSNRQRLPLGYDPARAAETFRLRRLRITPQRLAVFEALADLPDHPTAEQVHARVVLRMPHVTLKTVYSVLRDMEHAGLVQPLPVGSGAVRWDVQVRAHAHFVCTRCGRLLDLPVDPTVLLPLARRRVRARTVDGAVLVFRGRCDRCPDPPAPQGFEDPGRSR